MARRHRLSVSATSEELPPEPAGHKNPPRRRRQPPGPIPVAIPPLAGWEWLFLGVLIAAVFLAYQPAWQGGFIWDDDTHLLNNPVLRPGGVFRTWVPGTYCQLLAADVHGLLGPIPALGTEPRRIPSGQYRIARPFGDLDLAHSRVAARAGRPVCGGPVRAAPGQRRERGVDHATEKHPVVGADAAFRAPLPAPRAAWRPVAICVRRSPCSRWRRWPKA